MSNFEYHIPRTKQGQQTFDNLVQVSKDLFAERGYHSTSVNTIIKEAGIAAGTFYIYFKDKFSLYKYILQDYHKKIRAYIREATKDITSRFEQERQGIKAFIQFALADNHAYNIIWESMFVDQSLFVEYYEHFSLRYQHSLEESYQTGEVRNTNFETLSYILMGISNFVGLQVMFKKDITETQLEKILDDVMDVLVNGMFVTK